MVKILRGPYVSSGVSSTSFFCKFCDLKWRNVKYTLNKIGLICDKVMGNSNEGK